MAISSLQGETTALSRPPESKASKTGERRVTMAAVILWTAISMGRSISGSGVAVVDDLNMMR